MNRRSQGRCLPDSAASALESTPRPSGTPLVVVQREWNGWRTATVRVADIEDVHWWQPPGAHRPLIHGYVWCDRFLPGGTLHGCDPDSAPHRFRICVLKAHALIGTFAELSLRASAADAR
jgi:hypothetical protein